MALTLDLFIDQSGNPIPGETPPSCPQNGPGDFVGALRRSLTSHTRDGFELKCTTIPAHLPCAMDGSGTSDIYSDGHAMVALWSGLWTPPMA